MIENINNSLVFCYVILAENNIYTNQLTDW